MIQAFKHEIKHSKQEDRIAKRHDIIITVHETVVTVNENNEEVHKRIPKKINITRKVNESAKVLKQEKAQQLLNELEKIYTK